MDKEISIVQILKSSEFLSAAGDEAISQIAGTAYTVRYDKGDLIFAEGVECRGMYIVGKGAVKIFKIGPDGREHVIHVAEPGDIFGEAALFLGHGYPAYAAAIKNSVLVLLRKSPFLELLRAQPELSLKLLGAMAVWAHRLVTKLELLTLKDASARLAEYLLSRTQNGDVIELTIPKSTLAAQLDIAGETLSRLLNRFEAQGLIEVTGRRIIIRDKKMLSELAEGARSKG